MSINQYLTFTAVLLLQLLQSSCNANAPKDLPCERKCGSRKVAGGKIRVIPLNDSFSVECTPRSVNGVVTPHSIGTFEYNFLVFEDRSVANATGTSTTTLAGASQTPDRVPLGGVAIYPTVSGLTSVGIAGKGTNTAAEDWCTDSCGIATVQVTPLCAKGDVKVGIIVPGVTGEPLKTDGNPSASIVTSITNP